MNNSTSAQLNRWTQIAIAEGEVLLATERYELSEYSGDKLLLLLAEGQLSRVIREGCMAELFKDLREPVTRLINAA